MQSSVHLTDFYLNQRSRSDVSRCRYCSRCIDRQTDRSMDRNTLGVDYFFGVNEFAYFDDE